MSIKYQPHAQPAVTCSCGDTGTVVMAERSQSLQCNSGKGEIQVSGHTESTGRGHCPQAWVSPAGRKTFIPVNTGWGVQEVLRSDSGGRQRQHHPWAEPGRGFGSSKSLSEGADCRWTVSFMVLLLLLTPGHLTPVLLTPGPLTSGPLTPVLLTPVLLTPGLPLPSKRSPLSFSSAPYSQWPIFKKREDAPSVQGIQKCFHEPPALHCQKKCFLSILGENNLVVDNCSHLSV